MPKDFGDKKLARTITANGQTLSRSSPSRPLAQIISPMKEIGLGNTPPAISFEEKGPQGQGPRPLLAQRTARANEPLNLTVYATDDQKSTTTAKVFRLRRLEATANALKASGQTAPFAAAIAAASADPDPSIATPRLAAAAAAAGADAATVARYLGDDANADTAKSTGAPGEITFAPNPKRARPPAALP